MKTIAFASAAHEFRNPLNGIISSLDLLEEKIDIQKCGTNYNVAKNCSKLMLFLVNDIMDYA
jgi:signal transduction histidine kinase